MIRTVTKDVTAYFETLKIALGMVCQDTFLFIFRILDSERNVGE